MKLWQKENKSIPEIIESFTIGRDREFDMKLAKFDVEGSIAHVAMLGDVGLMTALESRSAITALLEILEEIKNSEFTIASDAEDIHSHIEKVLTERIGETGKKIHSGRSRNDQVALDIKLYLRSEILDIRTLVKDLFDLLITLSEKHKSVLMPGYTHLQIAMPSSFGLWFGAYAESFVDDMEMLAAAHNVVNKNPLGSGAGYGSSFELNRQMTTDLLNFPVMNYNSIYAQMSRGKTEKIIAGALGNVAGTLSRLAMDCCLYMNQNFGFISFPDELTTGSSIMPHKKNPDVFELIRAKCNRIQSIQNELSILLTNLPSGYHRDLQLTKEILFPAFETLQDCLKLCGVMLSGIKVKENILEDEKYKFIFTVEVVNELVNKGITFRDAYRQIGQQVESNQFSFNFSKGLHHSHEGSIGNLMNSQIIGEMEKVLKKF